MQYIKKNKLSNVDPECMLKFGKLLNKEIFNIQMAGKEISRHYQSRLNYYKKPFSEENARSKGKILYFNFRNQINIEKDLPYEEENIEKKYISNNILNEGQIKDELAQLVIEGKEGYNYSEGMKEAKELIRLYNSNRSNSSQTMNRNLKYKIENNEASQNISNNKKIKEFKLLPNLYFIQSKIEKEKMKRHKSKYDYLLI